MKKPTDPKDIYDTAKRERKYYVDAVLNSPSKMKIVVGGPGTGKTYLFKKILEGKNKSLTLTFVNSLVEDLSLELCWLSEVKTLHSFARSILHRPPRIINIFPKLSIIIKQDARILLNKTIEFDQLFYNKEDDKNENIKFYKKRKQYYNYYGYSDIIFGAVLYLEINKDKIPYYDQVVVDEFQDFNRLEVSLIDLLSEKSPVLLAGDDDQALYDFKSASPDHIRERFSDKNSVYASFSLPHCSRCTRVIVGTANDIINAAEKYGFLKNRINKRYHYFEDEDKEKESIQYPKVVYAQVFDRRIPWFIEQEIGNIAKDIKDNFTVLIISPTKKHGQLIVKALKNKGFSNIKFVEKKDPKEKPNLMDGLKILLEDKKSNLGWRIVSEFFLDQNVFNSLIKETDKNKDIKFIELIDINIKKEVNRIIKVLRAIKSNRQVDTLELDNLLEKIGHDPYKEAKDILRHKIISDSKKLSIPGLKKIHIKSTTIQSSKGLSADYVFITHFDNQYFVKNKDKTKIADQDICNFLVALTRAKRKVFLISSKEEEPTFLTWINEERIDKLPSLAVIQRVDQGE